MKTLKFTKMVASGNDFIVIESHKVAKSVRKPPRRGQSHRNLARKLCDRKFGIGADGLLILENSRVADVKMRIFNADGSEAEMCGNGARCVAYFKSQSHAVSAQVSPKGAKSQVKIETMAGIIGSEIKADNVKIKLTDPKNIKLDIPLKVNKRNLKANFIDTGVPHVVVFVQGLNQILVKEIGRAIRYHKKFSPRGTNVNFIEVLKADLIKIRTYERGVEDETLACGTGSVAAALIFALKAKTPNKINIETESGEVLKVYFKKFEGSFRDVWLEGKVKIICKGAYYV